MKSNIELNYEAITFRKQYQEDEYSNIDIFDIANKIPYLTVVSYPFSNHISGVCIQQENANIIAINSTMSYGRQRFSLAHELYHLVYVPDKGITISNLNYQDCNETEKEANIFASYLLAPYNSLKDYVKELDNVINEINLVKIEQHFGISHKALLTRLSIDQIIDNDVYTKYQDIDLKNISNQLGYDDSLYMNNSESKLYTSFGNYIRQTSILKEKEVISLGKYNELLSQAYREDLIYNQNTNEVIND